MNVQRLSFKAGEAICNAGELFPQRSQILQSLVQAEIFHPVDADLYPQEGTELFVHTTDEIVTVDPHHMMAMVELLDNAVQLAPEPSRDTYSKNVSYFVGDEAEQPHLARALEDFMDGEVPFEKMKFRQYSIWLIEYLRFRLMA